MTCTLRADIIYEVTLVMFLASLVRGRSLITKGAELIN